MKDKKIYEGDVIDFIEETEPTKYEKFKMWLGRKVNSTIHFIDEHSKEIVVATPIVVGAAKGIAKVVKKPQYKKERERIDHTYYDPRTGAHWALKRKLNNWELKELMRRRSNGEDSGDILESMHLLK